MGARGLKVVNPGRLRIGDVGVPLPTARRRILG